MPVPRNILLLFAYFAALVLILAPYPSPRVAASRASPRNAHPKLADSISEPESATHNHKAVEAGIKSFMIHMVDGVATCRAATLEEIPSTLPGPDNKGVSVEVLLESEQKSQRTIQLKSATGLTINLLALSQLQNDANRSTVIAAFQRGAATWASRIKSPITVNMNIDYGFNRPSGSPFPDGVVGATSTGTLAVDYPTARANLQTSASSAAEAAIYNSLPTQTIPTNTGNGAVLEVSRALAQALGFLPLNPDDTVATISFNKDFDYDFNPDNGIASDRVDFVGVAAHEIGHALGFISNAGDGSTAPLTTWDMFRFRPGTTAGTFTGAQRIMSTGGSQAYFTTQNFAVEGLGTNELRLSTGGPDGDEGDGNQSSHWKADELTGLYIGIMDPTIAEGEREVTTENDFVALESLGWNLVSSVAPPLPPTAPDNDGFSSARVLVGCSSSVTGTNLNATMESSEPNHSPDNNGGTHSVWYRWQSPGSGNVTMTTAGSAYDTVLAIYAGTNVNSLTLIARNDDIPDVPGQPHQISSSVTFSATAGTVYRIAVDGYNNGGSGGDMGPLKLNWTENNCTEPSPLVTSEAGTNDAFALDAVTFVQGPFRKTSFHNFSADQATRVMIFTSSLGLSQPDASILSVQAAGMSLPVENVGPVTGVPGLDASFIVVRLPDGLQPGGWPLTVTLRNAVSSNSPTLRIAP